MPVIDCDQHLFEGRDLWAEHLPPGERHLALRLEDDELGHTWLTWGDERVGLAFEQVPGDTARVGRQVQRVRAGLRAERSYDEVTPAAYHDPAARLAHLDEVGIDEAVLFPNYGLLWERHLADHLPATLANMGAWNRWAVEVAAVGRGRLHPVAHCTLRDLEWLVGQLDDLAAGGVRLAMVSPGLVDGRALSHPELDRAWAAFADHGIAPVFHVADQTRPFAEGWFADDPDEGNPVLASVFLGTAPALAVADLAVHGVFERHPGLRLGVVELSAIWVPQFLLALDGGFDFHARFNGAPLRDLPRRPSEYVRRQVRVAAFSYEQPDRLTRQAGDLFMFCSDFPHSEGTATALDDYRRSCPAAPSPDDAPGLYGDNAAWLLGR